MTSENNEQGDTTHESPTVNNKAGSNASDLSLKEYFDEKLYPHLSAALSACASERPDDPVSFVGKFLINAAKGRRSLD